jgi:hypothetical protein
MKDITDQIIETYNRMHSELYRLADRVLPAGHSQDFFIALQAISDRFDELSSTNAEITKSKNDHK